LNANHIARRHPTPDPACVGGFDVTIKVIGRTTQTLTAYECGGHNYGATAGNVTGFLAALRIPAP
jgi:hypothetical protein